MEHGIEDTSTMRADVYRMASQLCRRAIHEDMSQADIGVAARRMLAEYTADRHHHFVAVTALFAATAPMAAGVVIAFAEAEVDVTVDPADTPQDVERELDAIALRLAMAAVARDDLDEVVHVVRKRLAKAVYPTSSAIRIGALALDIGAAAFRARLAERARQVGGYYRPVDVVRGLGALLDGGEKDGGQGDKGGAM
jgi:hypothetical protein